MPFALILPPLLFAALFLFLPFLSAGRFFTIPVPADWRTGPQARRIRNGYQGLVLAIAAGSTALCIWAGSNNRIVYSVAVAEPLALLAVWSWGWNRTLPARLHHPVLRSASLSTTSSLTSSLFWTLAALLPLAAVACYLAVRYDSIPLQFPIHYTAKGAPDHIVARSPLTVFGPFLFGAALLLLLTILLYIVSRRSAGIPDAGRYSSLTRYVFVGSAWFVALQFSAVTLLPILPHPGVLATHLTAASSGFLVLLLLVTFGYFFRHRSTLAAAQAATAEEHWKGGLWYYNPNDAALFVPKRMGFGYTLNMAHPESWLLMAATLVIALVPVALKHL